MDEKEKIKEVIKANPGAVLLIDNDSWELMKTSPDDKHRYPPGYDGWDEVKQEGWNEDQYLIEGGNELLLIALAEMAGITCEWV